MYRLTTSTTGSYNGSNEQHRYAMEMQYNSVGSILQKTQVHERSGADGTFKTENQPSPRLRLARKTTYDIAYEYGDEQPHAAKHIGDRSYSYDANLPAELMACAGQAGGNQTGCLPAVAFLIIEALA